MYTEAFWGALVLCAALYYRSRAAAAAAPPPAVRIRGLAGDFPGLCWGRRRNFQRLRGVNTPYSASNCHCCWRVQMSAVDAATFKGFQRNWLLVYLLAFFAVGIVAWPLRLTVQKHGLNFVCIQDWLQGPYVYALYDSYGFKSDDIALLFIMGFCARYGAARARFKVHLLFRFHYIIRTAWWRVLLLVHCRTNTAAATCVSPLLSAILSPVHQNNQSLHSRFYLLTFCRGLPLCSPDQAVPGLQHAHAWPFSQRHLDLPAFFHL